MCLDTDEAAGNMGLLDMGDCLEISSIYYFLIFVSFHAIYFLPVTGLQWVHEHIAYFGGDPNR